MSQKNAHIETALVPPQAIDLEKVLLGAVLLDKRAKQVAFKQLKVEDFYHPPHTLIYQSMQDMYQSNLAIDMLTLHTHLKERGQIEEVGGIAYLMELTDKVASSAHIDTWCVVLKDKSIKRSLMQKGMELYQDAGGEVASSSDLLTKVQTELMRLSAGHHQYDRDPEDIARAAMLDMTTPNTTGITGIPLTGIYEVDYQMNGGEKGDLIIVAARPSMGKSMLANTIVCHLDSRNVKVLLWGLEMDEEQNFKMYASNMGNLDYTDVKRGKINPSDVSLSYVYERYTQDRYTHIVGQVGVNVGQIRAKVTEKVVEHGIQVVVIDHGRLIRKNMLKTFNDIEEISLITNTLKQLAKELQIPVVLLWQLSRNVTQRGGDKRPQMSDLRGSGTLEEDADKILLIHRDYYYSKQGNPGGAEFILAKVRGGETGDLPVYFNPTRARFEKADEDDWTAADELKF